MDYRLKPRARSARVVVLSAVTLVIGAVLSAGEVTLAWDPNSEPDLAGYKLYYGLGSGQYDEIIDVGNVTTNTVTGIEAGLTYYFVVTAYNTAGLESDPSNEVSYTVPFARIVGRHIFYNQSAWDGNDSAANVSDDSAIAPDKQALLPGQTATFANYTSYSRGINGIMIDIAGLAGTPTAEDFGFKVGNNNDPTTWAQAPLPTSITVRQAAGLDGSDRITLIWPNWPDPGSIAKQWLQVTVQASLNTDLAYRDEFYFGNAVGETGDSSVNALVSLSDLMAVRANYNSYLEPVSTDCPHDIDRDRMVNLSDYMLVINNGTGPSTMLLLISVPSVRVGLATAATPPMPGGVSITSAVASTGSPGDAVVGSEPPFDSRVLVRDGAVRLRRWTAPGTLNRLQSATSVTGPWQDVPESNLVISTNGVEELLLIINMIYPNQFFRWIEAKESADPVQ